MRCVDCHGGDPSSLKQEEAHTNRTAHPVINENVSKCRECHPAECEDRVREFDQVAGISNVRVALPYQPLSAVNAEESEQAQPAGYPGWLSVAEVTAPILISGLVLVIYLAHRRRQNKSTNRSHK
jgi:hypothetical protein